MKRPAYTRIFLACLSVVAGSSVAYAGEGDVFTPYVGYGVASDDNMSRAPDSGDRISDSWQTTTFGLRVDKMISRQRLSANVSINDTKYDRFKQYDNNGRNLSGTWGWVLGNHFNGNLGVTYSEGLTPFSDGSPVRSVVTQKRTFLDGEWHFHPSWRLDGSVSRTEVDYDTFSAANLRLNTAEIGFGYSPKTGNLAAILLRHSTGEYPNGLNGYTQDEAKANIRWQVTGKTNLQFLGGWADRNFDTDGNKDYSGFDARLTASWAATGKTSFVLAAYREIGSGVGTETAGNVTVPIDPANAENNYFANFSLNTGASLSATWQATSKITVDATVLSEKRDYNGVGNVFFPADRSDRYRRNTIGITFLPLRQLNIRASVYQQHLDSNFALASYSTKGFQLTTRYEF
jgi:exopolysaccharide biosynthesis operon protein EpsL